LATYHLKVNFLVSMYDRFDLGSYSLAFGAVSFVVANVERGGEIESSEASVQLTGSLVAIPDTGVLALDYFNSGLVCWL
jgi:hypothetical protein